MFILISLCLFAGILPGLSSTASRRSCRALIGDRMPAQASIAWLSIVPIAESRSSYNGLLVFFFITASASLASLCYPPPRVARRPPCPGLGLRLPRSEPGDAIHGGQLRPADPPRLRHVRLPRPREGRDAAARRPRARRGSKLNCTIRPGSSIYTPVARAVAFAAEQLNSLQFLTIRQYLSLVFFALVFLLLVLALWP